MPLIKPLTLGKLTFTHNLIQGPLAGYSCAPMRVLTSQFIAPAFCMTEMISAHDLVHRKNPPKRYLFKDPNEPTLCYQISGNEPDTLAKATDILNQQQAQMIDLNCGCPVNKIRTKGCGSKLLTTPELLYQLIHSIKNNTDAVVSIKIRVATPLLDHDELSIIQAAEAANVDFITVHGRHWTHKYDIACQFDAIKRIVNMTNKPIIANGDVEDYESCIHLIKHTNCAGVMIARASVGQPWLFAKILAEHNQQSFTKPTQAQIGALFLQHIQGLINLEHEHLAILQARKLAKYYSRELSHRLDFTIKMQEVKLLAEVSKLIKEYFFNEN